MNQMIQVFQDNQLNLFLKRGLPTRKEEAWKYTNVASLVWNIDAVANENQNKNVTRMQSHAYASVNKIVFVNGIYSEKLSELKNLPKDVVVAPLSLAMHEHEKVLKPYLQKEFDVQAYPFAVLNSARMQDGLVVIVPKNAVVSEPIHCVYYSTQQERSLVCPRNLILLAENTDVTIIEEYISEAGNHIVTPLTEVYADTNARVHYHKIQDENISATHLSNIFIHQNQDSFVELVTLSKGALLSREDVTVNVSAKGAECNLLGLYTLKHNGQHTDHHLHVAHKAEHGTSSMLYKGILDKQSRAVFNGKVYVHPDAQRINALQANHNLLLSKEAEVNTKPELEIYADDVKCAHGATIGQLDEESLFYLRSRGVEKGTATRVLLDAFADEVISKIKNMDVRRYIQKRVGSYVEL